MGLNIPMFYIQELQMVFRSPFYKSLKTDTIRKSHKGEGVPNEEFFMD